eukprot:6174453-Pleurochrysis_carterae.AAC.2
MAMAPSGRGVSASPRGDGVPALRGSPGRSRPLRLLLGGPVGWESARPSGMGSRSSWPAGVRARLRREANAGGVTRAASTHARTPAESRGPSATRPPSMAPVVTASGCGVPPLPPAAPSSRSARAAFICGG